MKKRYLIIILMLSILNTYAFSEDSRIQNWKENYNFNSETIDRLYWDNNGISQLSQKIESNNNQKIKSGINYLRKLKTPLNPVSHLKNQNEPLSNDTLIIGVPPLDTLTINGDSTINSTILVVLNGLLKIKNANVNIFGDIIMFNNGKVQIENSYVSMPQQFFYQRMIFLTGNSQFEATNSTLDFSGLSHTMGSAQNSKVIMTNITNKGFTTNGLYGSGSIIINGSNEAGEFVMSDSCLLSIKNATTALLWHHIPDGAKFIMNFPSGDTVHHYECNKSTNGVSGINLNVQIDTCTNVMWGLMPENGSEIKISDSHLRTIGIWAKGFLKANLSGMVDNTHYQDFLFPDSSFNLELKNTLVDTWSLYAMDNSNISLTGSIIGEIGAEQRSQITANKVFCDGTGGYLWGTDTTFTVIGFSSATTSVRSQGNGIVVFAYSALTMGQALAVNNSILMVLQSSVPDEPIPYDNACVWYGNIEKPATGNVNSMVPIIGSVWITKTATSHLMNFDHYNLYYRMNITDDWKQINSSTSQVRHDVLGILNTKDLAIGNYSLRMVIYDNFRDSVDVNSSINLLPESMSVPENKAYYSVQIYPEPANDYCIISVKGIQDIKNLRIYDIFGCSVNAKNEILSDNEIKIDTSDLPNGVYFIMVGSKVYKLVKE